MPLFNLISHQLDNDKTYLCTKDPYETKYRLLINKHEDLGLKHCYDPKALYEWCLWKQFNSNDMGTDMVSNKKIF